MRKCLEDLGGVAECGVLEGNVAQLSGLKGCKPLSSWNPRSMTVECAAHLHPGLGDAR
jgi:hypothetical protein